MVNKTISINPSLFTLGGTKTKKNREKKLRSNVVPLISPNVLKNKLLKRIKEHKVRETENLETNKKHLTDITSIHDTTSKAPLNSDLSFNDEFNDSISYLQTLSKQKKINEEKMRYERNKQKKIEDLARKTVKNYNNEQYSSTSYVNVELPEELKQPFISVNTEQFTLGSDNPSIRLNHRINDDIPYGILKGGTKPTYRDWNKTQRNLIVTNPNASLIIPHGSINNEKLERENRLNRLRDKLKYKNHKNEINQSNDNNMDNIMMTQNLIQKPLLINENPSNNNNNNIISLTTSKNDSIIPLSNNQLQIYNSTISLDENPKILLNNQQNFEPIKKKRIIKKTIKRKYTLGKSNIKKCVSILLKDRGTRRNIITAQKDLKNKSINDIKSYLRNHNLIKIGSNAPNDVIRKMYESAMLAGEITNNNTETLLHNLLKQ